MKYAKIAIIGSGAVGSTTAYAILWKNIAAEIILIDIDEKRCKGEILDLADTLPFCGASKIRQGTTKDAQHAHIIIIAAGARQKPGQPRAELITTNKNIIESIAHDLKDINKDAIIIMVTNPVDTLTLLAQKLLHLPQNQIFGSGTSLDSQRLRGLLCKKLSIAEQSINAYILGEHGDTQFPAWSSLYITGIPILNFPQITKEGLHNMAEETKNRAYEIIECKGATYFGIAACVADMCEAIIFDQKRIIPISSYNNNFDVCLSMPSVIGSKGIEQTLPIHLTTEEQALLKQSAEKLYTIKKQYLS